MKFYSSGKNRRPVVMIMQALGHAGDHYVGFFFYFKEVAGHSSHSIK